jgi:hypothetical protein
VDSLCPAPNYCAATKDSQLTTVKVQRATREDISSLLAGLVGLDWHAQETHPTNLNFTPTLLQFTDLTVSLAC